MKEKVRENLRNEVRINTVRKVHGILLKNRSDLIKRIPVESLKKKVREIKEKSIDNIDTLVKTATESFQANGATVYLAKSPQEAIDRVLEICNETKTVARTPSETMVEIGLEKVLRDNGFELIDTDTGALLHSFIPEEEICSYAFPVVHVPLEHLARRISEKVGKEVNPDVKDITRSAVDYALQGITRAGVGISGANSITAQEGSVFLLHNQGNINRVIGTPRKHIVMSGIEKIVPSLGDAIDVVKLQDIWQTGRIVRHVNIISGPTRSSNAGGIPIHGVYGPEEVHIILLDSWRKRAIEEGFKEFLYCIKCLSCTNYCPTYDRVGMLFSHKNTLIGARGVIYSSFSEGLDDAIKSGLYLCLTCGACVKECPVDINLDNMVERIRVRAVQSGMEPEVFSEMEKKVKETMNVLRVPNEKRVDY
jgi:L-lactate utilization protein LutB